MISEYIDKYRAKGVLVDTNLLLLLFIGGVGKGCIPGFKRTSVYSVDDYSTLLALLDKFQRVIVTPSILTEVSNLSNGLYGDRLRDFYEVFRRSLSEMSELYVESDVVSSVVGFHAYGLADAGIVVAAKGRYLVLTDDLRFASFARNNGVDVINFNHVREVAWELSTGKL